MTRRRPALAAAREPEPPRGWRVAEIARATRIPRSSLYRAIARGELVAVRFSSAGLIVLDADLHAFLDAHRTGRR
jgi:DNA-binding IclR family transcriptional regulator